jgi:general secretion pathway protein E
MLECRAMSRESASIPDASPAQSLVRELIGIGLARSVSDIHIEPAADDYEVRYRIDGLLQLERMVEPDLGRAMVTALMVMAELLTYRQDVPQEGRITFESDDGPPVDLRLAIMPTTHGLRAAIRLPAIANAPQALDELQLPSNVLSQLQAFTQSAMGLLLVVGPAGSGKTTTIYALLRHLVQTQPGLSVVSLEDPVEADLPGVTQIQVTPFGELTYERALRSVLRQDPQVLVIGEIRDAATASIVVEAALTGHRVISTMHAGSPASTVARLIEMDIEPYQIASALFGVLSQRLLRRRNPQAQYEGRFPVAQLARVDTDWRRLIVDRADTDALAAGLAHQPNYQTLTAAGQQAVAEGWTDQAEVERVLGASGQGNK